MTPEELAKAILWRHRLTPERFRKAVRHVESTAHFEALLRAIPEVQDRESVRRGLGPLVEAKLR